MKKKETDKAIEIASQIQELIYYIIPEKWKNIELYISMPDIGIRKGEMFFYYLPNSIFKRQYINCYEVPYMFNISEKEYSDIMSKLYNKFMILKEELNNKSSSILKYILNLELDSKIAKDEADRLDNLSKSKMNKVKKLKEYLINIMQYLDKKKIETDLGCYGIRKSTKVQIVDETLIPEDFIKIKTEKTLDKIGIANYIKNYGELAGAKIIENYSLQIR